jgi:hypothetical protein
MSKLSVSIDSYANMESDNIHEIDFEVLDTTEEQWDNLTEEEQFALVTDYWHRQGLPEITFEKVEDTGNEIKDGDTIIDPDGRESIVRKYKNQEPLKRSKHES